MNAILESYGMESGLPSSAAPPTSTQSMSPAGEEGRTVRLSGNEINETNIPDDLHGALQSIEGLWHLGVMNFRMINDIPHITMNAEGDEFRFIRVRDVKKVLFHVGTPQPPARRRLQEDFITFYPSETIGAMKAEGRMIPLYWKTITMQSIVKHKGERAAIKTRDGNWTIGTLDFFNNENVPYILMSGKKNSGMSRSTEVSEIQKILLTRK